MVASDSYVKKTVSTGTRMATPFPINMPPSLSKETSQTPLTLTCIDTIEVVILCGAGRGPRGDRWC